MKIKKQPAGVSCLPAVTSSFFGEEERRGCSLIGSCDYRTALMRALLILRPEFPVF